MTNIQYLYDEHTVQASCVELCRGLGRAFNIFDKKYQRAFSSQQMPFLSPYNTVFSQRYIRNILPKQLHIRNLAEEFGTHVEDSFLDGILHNLSF